MVVKSGFSGKAEQIGVKLGVMFSRIPLTPNQWTLLSIVPAIAGFLALAHYHDMLAGLALFALSALLDAVDGGVARVTGTASNLGAYLDGMADRVVEGFLLFGLMFFGLPDAGFMGQPVPMWIWLAILLFIGTCLVSFSRAYADHRKALTDPEKLKRMGGVLERAERLILVFAGMLVYPAYPSGLNIAIIVAAILSAATLGQRVWFVVRNAE
jgi:phosphatidylglycerophosphate synthase